MIHRKYWLAALAMLALSTAAPAATRVIQFAGLAGGEFQTTVGANSDYSYCEVVIVNMGSQNEQINKMYFLGYDLGKRQTLAPASWTANGSNADVVVRRNSTGVSPVNTTCTGGGNQIAANGGMCMFRYATMSLAIDGRYTFCAGIIEVQDSSATAPGSIIAAGNITHIEEAQIAGGVLSAGLYLSGSHVYHPGGVPPNLAEHSSWALNSFGANASIFNMNFYCAAACNTSNANHTPMNYTRCVEHCGGGSSVATGEWVIGPTIGWLHPSSANGSRPRVAGNMGGAGAAVNPNVDPTANNTYFSHNTSNAHYAGGLVQEITMGPMNQICSGNSAFWENGGDEFSHAGGVDTHSIIIGNGGPPERLLCSHRHAKDDLYMSVGASTPFTINGGMPF